MMRLQLVGLLLLVTSTQVEAQAVGQTCVVADPTTTQLNLRQTPRGRLLSTIPNGESVTIREVVDDDRGLPWARLSAPRGWVFANYLDCAAGDSDENDAEVQQPAPRASPTAVGGGCLDKANDSNELYQSEVYNNGKLRLRIDGWSLQDGSGTIKLRSNGPTFNGTANVRRGGFYIIERNLCPGTEVSLNCKIDSYSNLVWWKCRVSEF